MEKLEKVAIETVKREWTEFLQVEINYWIVSQTSFSLYLHNQWTNFHKISCAVKSQIRAICTYVGCTKVTIDY